jgi:cell division cycle 14
MQKLLFPSQSCFSISQQVNTNLKTRVLSRTQNTLRQIQNNSNPHYEQKITDSIYLHATDDDESNVKERKANMPWLSYFSIDGVLKYRGFCDDFGPMSLGSTFEFFKILDSQIRENPGRSIVLLSKLETRALTNAVFLLGSYLIMKFDSNPGEVAAVFKPANSLLVSFRDVSPGEQNFHLQLRDCWAGLWRAKQLGWVKPSFQGFDATEYAHYGDPWNADLHEIVPGKFFAMRGPVGMPAGQLWRDVTTGDGRFCHRELSPAHYIDILRELDVQAVVRLNTPEYSKDIFTEAGLGFADLFFEDCTCPPAAVVAKFMLIAEGLPGALAVHCKSGLGRTGTLIGLYMMQHHGFTAREAMGWLRIVRPGSVIGPQQQYLVEREAVLRRTGCQYRRDGPNVALGEAGPGAVGRLIAEAVAVVDGRLRAARRPRRCASLESI